MCNKVHISHEVCVRRHRSWMTTKSPNLNISVFVTSSVLFARSTVWCSLLLIKMVILTRNFHVIFLLNLFHTKIVEDVFPIFEGFHRLFFFPLSPDYMLSVPFFFPVSPVVQRCLSLSSEGFEKLELNQCLKTRHDFFLLSMKVLFDMYCYGSSCLRNGK